MTSTLASGVRVTRRVGPHRAHDRRNTFCTSRFCAVRLDGVLEVEHDFSATEVSDEIADLLASELDDRGVLRGQDEFEQVFVGIVASTEDGYSPEWLQFYRNSLDRLERGQASFAPVHEHAEALLVGSRVVDLGSCFGFFPLRIAKRGFDVLATDLSRPTMDLLADIAPLLHRSVRTASCDAADVPLPDDAADTVTALHLLEHLPPAAADAVIAEALRVAHRRVVIAVPYEEEPRACYGHIARYDTDALREMAGRLCAQHPGLRADVHEFHGGWLILDQ
ncbi:MAG: mycofactocin oligosaccharide methyltransferase MftM [Mycobacterium sp.]